ncbi:MAG: nicotinate-nucleotide--dimethylbenzimidazole phosphoribosyltransferase [Dehalococcoidia bacterium]|nr:MAG: nicotinate-nucleotide--dimethylbenzimidazole phosphoribosyltransferase [Dehalococcoidia bacterium]
MHELITRTIAAIPEPDLAAMNWARLRQEQLTKPPGSLGRLEELAIRVVGITGQVPPVLRRKVVIVVAADHGVTVEGVSAYPREVTAQMVQNFLRGGAAINVLARGAGADVVVVDAGVDAELPAAPGLIAAKVRRGTGNLARELAMTRAEAEECLATGIRVVQAQIDRGVDLVATGDMGIGNTTPSSAITAVITGRPVAEVTGRGTGITAEQLRHKIQVIERALALHRPDPSDPIGVLSAVGGLEIGVLAGVMIGAAARRVPVVIDGFISGAAALIAVTLAPAVAFSLIAAHNSVEVGHRAILAHLEKVPLLNLDLRLGEGTGAVLAFAIIEQAVRILNEMATFREAGVSGRSAPREVARRFARRREGYLHALEGGIWDDPFRHVDGRRYRHIVSTDLGRLIAWAEARGISRSRIVRRDLRDYRRNGERVVAWHIDLGGPYLDVEP